jgi:hypothetical protein
LSRIPADWTVSAEFDGPVQEYRYKLLYRWGDGPLAAFFMTNPSGADERAGDMTVMKTSRIARRLGYGGQWIGNSCAYRHVSPKALLETEDPVGPGNHQALLEMARDAAIVVIAHGRLPGNLQRHAHSMCRLLQEAGHQLHVLRLTPDNVPMHPLARGKNFIPEAVTPIPWKFAERS